MSHSTDTRLHLVAAAHLREGDVFPLRLGYRATVTRVRNLGTVVVVEHTVTRPNGSTYGAAVEAAPTDAFSLLNRQTTWH